MKRQYPSIVLAVAMAGYAVFAGAAESVPSAELKQSQGRVFVGQDKAMGLAQEGKLLYPGDRVVTVSGASADIVYTDGCRVSLPQNSLLSIGGVEQCRAGLALVRSVEGFSGAVGGTVQENVAAGVALGVVGAVVITGLATDGGSDQVFIPSPPVSQ